MKILKSVLLVGLVGFILVGCENKSSSSIEGFNSHKQDMQAFQEYAKNISGYYAEKFQSASANDKQSYTESSMKEFGEYAKKVKGSSKEEAVKLTDTFMASLMKQTENVYGMSHEDWKFLIDPSYKVDLSAFGNESPSYAVVAVHQILLNNYKTFGINPVVVNYELKKIVGKDTYSYILNHTSLKDIVKAIK